MDLQRHFDQQKIEQLEQQILYIRSTLLNVIYNIRQAAEDSDYDEIAAKYNRWND